MISIMRTTLLILVLNLIIQCKLQKIAKSKCKEYGQAVYVEQNSPIMTRRAKTNKVSECGIVSVPLIIGGTKATLKEFPHMALLGFGEKPNVEWECGGALISEKYVLTAAHCLKSRNSGNCTRVKLGMLNIDQNDSDVQERKVIRRIPHPQYHNYYKLNDIALLELDSKVIFTPYVRPACLNTENRDFDSMIAIGFGKTDFEDSVGSKNLLKVTLKIYDNNECTNIYQNPRQQQNLNKIICAGDLNGNKDTCQGDSGGPIQIVLKEPYCMYNIIGVTSFGKFCGFPDSPAIYAKVSKYIDWIETEVW